MIRVLLSISLFVTLFFCAPTAHAIIFLPALVLIPIIKIVAILLGALSLPATGVAVLWSKLFGKPLSQTMSRAIVVLLMLAVVVAIGLKLHTPGRPLF